MSTHLHLIYVLGYNFLFILVVCASPGDLGIRPNTRVGQIMNVAFDMCAWEIWATLTNGGTLVIRGSRATEWNSTIKSIDVLISTPSIISRYTPSDYPNIKVIATAGEPCPQSLADRWAKHVTFYNCCGPTETTIVNTMHRHEAGLLLTIGKPTPNNSVYILDDTMQPVPLGECGTLWAGGSGVSNGYLGRPHLTAKRFKPDPFKPGMMYNTGDIGRWTKDGMVEHLGRLDDQVKVKGFRVELDGIAAAMNMCPGVTSSCAFLIGQELCGAYECPLLDVPWKQVRDLVAEIHPYYAVPSRFLALPVLPHTNNGKIDKIALKRCMSQI